MRVLIFDSYKNKRMDLVENFPSSYNIKDIKLYEKDINLCRGCLSCTWNMNKMDPGKCVLNDHMLDIYPTFIHSDLLIMITEIVFGGFSFYLKKTIDRLLPVLFNAPLRKRGTEMGHLMRYQKRPSIIGIGIQKEKDEKSIRIFKELVKKIAILWDVPYSSSITYCIHDDFNHKKLSFKNAINGYLSGRK